MLDNRMTLPEAALKRTLFALSLLIAGSANAQNYWIPAQEFGLHTGAAVDGSQVFKAGREVQLLAAGSRVRIDIGRDAELARFVAENPRFKVCAYVANYDSGATNTVRIEHPDPDASDEYILDGDVLKIICSDKPEVDARNGLSARLKVISPSPSTVQLRGVAFRPVEYFLPSAAGITANTASLQGYEYSRALGYLWGDGKVSSDGSSLTFYKKDSSVSNHFGSVARAFFGNRLGTGGDNGGKYSLRLDGISPTRFLLRGVNPSDIPDRRAFFSSVIETEGATDVGRLVDDPNRSRCEYMKALVDGLNPRCSANTCTDSSCATPNCAFIANSRSRGTIYRPEVNERCGVYLSGNSSDWRALFAGDDYHFVKTDRTPGGEPTRYDPNSRPAYTR